MLIIDRITEDKAVIEDGGKRLEIRVSEIWGEVKEGDVIIKKEGRYFSDKEATLKRRAEILKLQNELFHD